MARIAFLGGTGPEGLGLALRFALAGEHVIIGSRQPDRAEHAAESLRQHLGAVASAYEIHGEENYASVRNADIVVVTVPFEAVEPVLAELAPALAGKVSLDVVNPLRLNRGVFTLVPVPAGSAGELIQKLIPQSPVVSGFKNLSAKELMDIEHPIHGDVLLCSDKPNATDYFMDLIGRIPQLRAIDAGALANSRRLESITALLLNLNRRYRAITSIEILGLKL